MQGRTSSCSILIGCLQVPEYEVAYADVVPKDNQAVTTKKIEEERHHEVLGFSATR